MAIFSKNTDDIQDDVETQIAALRKEVSRLTASFSDIGGEKLDNVKKAATKQVNYAADAAKENPLATLAIVAGAALLIGLISRR